MRPPPTPRRGPSGCCSSALAADRALVLAFEDAHWAEPALLDLIDQLAGSALAAPVLLLCVGRPELLDARPAWAARAVLRPARAGHAGQPAPAERAARRCPSRPSVGWWRGRAATRSSSSSSRPTCASAPRTSSLPPALHALLAARLDALDTAQRRIIEAGAIEGETFHVGGLQALVPALGPRRDAGGAGRAGASRARAPGLPVHRRSARISLRARAGPRRGLRGDAAGRRGRTRMNGWPAGSSTSATPCPTRARASARSSSAPTAPRASCARRPRASRRSRTDAAQRLAEAADKVHRRGDLPSEIAFLERALALLAPGDRDQRGAAAGHGRPPSSRPAASSARRAWPRRRRPPTIDRVRLRGEVERARMVAYRHPESVDPGAGLAVAEDAAVALEKLGDDIGVTRARCLMCELAWMQGASERGLSEARTALRFARRDPAGTVDLDATVSVIAWALVVNQRPGGAARAECLELLAVVAGRRFAELGVRGFVAVLDAMAGDFETGARAARCARARGCASSGCARPRSGWRCSMPRSGCWRATPLPPGTRSTTPRAWRARSAIACSWRRSGSSARTSCSPRTASRRPRRRWRASTRGPRPTTSSGASSA